MNEFKTDMNLPIRETIEQVISDQVLPTISETLGEISRSARMNADLTSSERHWSPKTHCHKKDWENLTKLNRAFGDQNRHNIENSFDPHSSDEDYDNYT